MTPEQQAAVARWREAERRIPGGDLTLVLTALDDLEAGIRALTAERDAALRERDDYMRWRDEEKALKDQAQRALDDGRRDLDAVLARARVLREAIDAVLVIKPYTGTEAIIMERLRAALTSSAPELRGESK